MTNTYFKKSKREEKATVIRRELATIKLQYAHARRKTKSIGSS